MDDRCPQCKAEYGPDDRYCPRCGISRSGGTRRHAAGPATAAEETAASPAAAAPTEAFQDEEDFVPLVIPPEPRAGWSPMGGGGSGRTVVAVLIGLVLLGIIAAGAWLAIGMGDDTSDDALGRSELPAWVVGGTPRPATPVAGVNRGATPDAHDVASNNMESELSPAATLPMISSQTGAAGEVSTPVPAQRSQGAVTAPSATTPPPSVAPSPTVPSTPTPTPTVPQVPASTFPNRVADTLVSVASSIEPPAPMPTATSAATPSPPAPTPTRAPGVETTPSLPASAGDGTGGAVPTTPPE
jgi:hypothetical protein